MSRNYSKLTEKTDIMSEAPDGKWHLSWMILGLPVFVVASFFLAQAIVLVFVSALNAMHLPISSLNSSIADAVLSAALYIITLALVLLVPLFIKKRRTSRAELGYARLPSWTDILITPAGLVVYLILSSLLMLVVSRFFVKININQPQDVGFSHISQQFEYILAFITLVVIAPVAEETLFRGFLFSKLKKFMPFWAAILITSAIFGAIHGQWDLAIDTFALSVVLCLLREITGSLWASILLHMTKNGIAFYFLFINPLLLNTLVK